MKSKRLPGLIWLLTVVLVSVYLLLQLADYGNKAYPSAYSYLPSGASAYAELLKRLGYEVEISRSPHPKLGPKDIAIVYQLHGGSSFHSNPLKAVEDKLKAYGFKNALVLYLNENFQKGSKLAQEGSLVTDGSSEIPIKLSIGDRYGFSDNLEDFWSFEEGRDDPPTNDGVALFLSRGFLNAFAVQSKSHGRDVIHVGDAIGTTNRFIDKEQNAAFFSGILQFFDSAGKKVVFIEDAIHNSEGESLLGMLAPWSGPARLQILLLAVLTAWILGKRFGLPESRRYRQSGSKELVDAIADTSLRARATDFAMAQILEDCERQVRNALKVGRDVKLQDLLKMLPTEVAEPFSLCAAALREKIPEGDAVKLISRLQASVDGYLGRYQRPIRKRRSKS